MCQYDGYVMPNYQSQYETSNWPQTMCSCYVFEEWKMQFRNSICAKIECSHLAYVSNQCASDLLSQQDAGLGRAKTTSNIHALTIFIDLITM